MGAPIPFLSSDLEQIHTAVNVGDFSLAVMIQQQNTVLATYGASMGLGSADYAIGVTYPSLNDCLAHFAANYASKLIIQIVPNVIGGTAHYSIVYKDASL